MAYSVAVHSADHRLMNRFKTLLALTLIAMALCACGNKGALYLPEDDASKPSANQTEDSGEEDGS